MRVTSKKADTIVAGTLCMHMYAKEASSNWLDMDRFFISQIYLVKEFLSLNKFVPLNEER
jgi:hypothetical protein